jgi:DNA-directed RNA polymerase specialized sigma24 family protein
MNKRANKKNTITAIASEPAKPSMPLPKTEYETVSFIPLKLEELTRASFEQVVIRYQSGIQRFIAGVVGNNEVARDLTQETFFLAYRYLVRQSQTNAPLGKAAKEGAAIANLAGWLFTIARNLAISELRHCKVIQISPFWQSNPDNFGLEELNASSFLDTLEPGGGLEARVVLHDELERAIKVVDPRKVTPLLLHLKGFSMKEISEMTGATLPCVRSQIFRARASLRAVLTSPLK